MFKIFSRFKNFLGSYWFLRLLALPIFLLVLPFFYIFFYSFYQRELSKISPQSQIFFLALDQYGVILQLLFYVRCWGNNRNNTIIVVFTPQVGLIKALAKHICPDSIIVAPPIILHSSIHRLFGVFSRFFIFTPLYYKFSVEYPEALYINETRKDNKSGYVKYLDDVYVSRGKISPFWDAYVQTRNVFDCRYDVTQDFFRLAKVSNRIGVKSDLSRDLLLNLNISGKYVVLNINVKDYGHLNQNSRRIFFPQRYNILIDHLIKAGFTVVLQGAGEQPHFSPRKGFIDYAHSSFQSPVNDLALFNGCEFFVSSKSGTEWYGLICDKPILGLNYTELTSMQPSVRFRFFPKRIRDEFGNILPWQFVLSDPVYFQLGRTSPSRQKFQIVEMEEFEIIAALDEFLQLLPLPRDKWLCYSPLQIDFKNLTHPGHLDLFYISGVPCDAYLK